jgi:membrane protease YdiL (CAAX protease family)
MIPSTLDAALVRAITWIAAALTGALVFRLQTSRGQARFQLALFAGAVTAHLGWALLYLPRALEHPEWVLQPGTATLLFFPLGVLLVAPWREALAALPLAMAVARAGCLLSSCCCAEPWHALPEICALVLLHALARRWPQHAAVVVLSGFGAIRLLVLPLRIPLDPSPITNPAWLALCWIAAGVALDRRLGSSETAREWITEHTQPLIRAVALMLSVWLVFPLVGRVVASADSAFIAASLLATGLVVATCARGLTAPGPRTLRLATAGAIAGLACGLAASAAFEVFRLAGAATADTSGRPTSFGVVLSIVLLAPLFEELLYRRRLLDALRRLWGPVPALVASSVLFALAHGDPLSMGIPLLGGMASAALVLRTGSVSPSIGMHVGWNAVAVWAVS